MAINTKISWSKQNTSAISLSANVQQNQKAILNGILSNPVNNTASFVNVGYRRNISITSAQNTSATSSVIKGTVNGNLIEETVVNPNATTVYSLNSFDFIESITVTGGTANGISYGTGNIGFILLPTDMLNRVYPCPSAQIVINGAGLDCTVYITLDKRIIDNGKTFDTMITEGTFLPDTDYENLTESSFIQAQPDLSFNYFLIKINASTVNDYFDVIYMQL